MARLGAGDPKLVDPAMPRQRAMIGFATRLKRGAAAAILLLAASACGRDSAPRATNLFDEAAGPVVFNPVVFDTLWMHGGPDDTVLLNADRLAAFPGGDAAVLDILGQRVHRVSADGVVWSWGTKGEGPGEIGRVRSLSVDGSGEVLLADPENARLLWVSGDGNWQRAAPLPEGVISIDDIAALDDGDYILSSVAYSAFFATPEPWIRVSRSGQAEGPVSVPWHGFLTMSPMQTTGHMASTRSSGRQTGAEWVFGFALGNGFFVFGDEGAEPHPYVRHGNFPEIAMSPPPGGGRGFQMTYATGRPPTLTRDLAVRADTLFVLAGNHWDLDRYSLATGSYLDTVRLPLPARYIAMAGDTLLALEAGSLYPKVVALRARDR